MITATTLASGALLFAVAASAQDAPEALDPAHMETQETATETATQVPGDTGAAQEIAPEAAGQDYTDAEIASFAAAAMAIRELQGDETLDDTAMRSQAEAIVAENGLDAQTYNAIGTAAQSDPEVAQRVQLALAQMQDNSDS